MKFPISEIIRKHHQRIGKMGGLKTKKRGAAFYRAIQKKSVESRKRNKKAIHS